MNKLINNKSNNNKNNNNKTKQTTQQNSPKIMGSLVPRSGGPQSHNQGTACPKFRGLSVPRKWCNSDPVLLTEPALNHETSPATQPGHQSLCQWIS